MKTPRIFLLVALLALTSFAALPQPAASVKKITAVLVVDKIEPSIPFFVERLGFEMTVSIPEGENLGFAILVRDEIELMLQTLSSVEAENSKVAKMLEKSVQMIYLEVEGLDEIEKALEGSEIAIPKKTTFYGATEIGVREPGGHLLVFAEFAQTEEAQGD